MKNEVLKTILIAIKKKRRKLTPEVVVREASEPDHPLHGEFDWDDASAAHKHRLDTAARLIRSVTIKVVKDDGTSYRVREWHAVRAAGVIDAPQGYVPNEEVLSEPQYRQAMLRQMERDWKALVDRYEHLKEFWAMVAKTQGQKKRRKAG